MVVNKKMNKKEIANLFYKEICGLPEKRGYSRKYTVYESKHTYCHNGQPVKHLIFVGRNGSIRKGRTLGESIPIYPWESAIISGVYRARPDLRSMFQKHYNYWGL